VSAGRANRRPPCRCRDRAVSDAAGGATACHCRPGRRSAHRLHALAPPRATAVQYTSDTAPVEQRDSASNADEDRSHDHQGATRWVYWTRQRQYDDHDAHGDHEPVEDGPSHTPDSQLSGSSAPRPARRLAYEPRQVVAGALPAEGAPLADPVTPEQPPAAHADQTAAIYPASPGVAQTRSGT
jgi:hypothetical protein